MQSFMSPGATGSLQSVEDWTVFVQDAAASEPMPPESSPLSPALAIALSDAAPSEAIEASRFAPPIPPLPEVPPLPEPLLPEGTDTVLYEFIRMPDSAGFGDYT